MKICFLIRSLNRGGAERQVTQLAEDLKQRGNEVRVITFYPGGPFGERLADAGIAVRTMNKRSRWDILGFSRRLRKELRSDTPDVIYSFLTSANVVAAVMAFFSGRLPVVWGIRSSDMDLSRYGTIDRLVAFVEKLLAKLPRRVISNSAAGANHARDRGFPAERITVIGNGIDLDAFRPDPSARKNLRLRLELADQTPLIGMVARYDPMKGIDVFLQAAKQFSAVNASVRFLLVGSGMVPSNTLLKQAIDTLGLQEQILLMPPDDNVAALLSGLDIATLSSRFGEGFSNVIGEAMACGTPVVATSVGDAVTIIGDTGWVVPREDPAALSDAWQTALNMSAEARSDLGVKARERISNSYARGAIAGQTEKILTQAIEA